MQLLVLGLHWLLAPSPDLVPLDRLAQRQPHLLEHGGAGRAEVMTLDNDAVELHPAVEHARQVQLTAGNERGRHLKLLGRRRCDRDLGLQQIFHKNLRLVVCLMNLLAEASLRNRLSQLERGLPVSDLSFALVRSLSLNYVNVC